MTGDIMNRRPGYFCLCLTICVVLLAASNAGAQIVSYAQTFTSPMLQASTGGQIGFALSNPTLSAVQVVATARSYTGEVLSGPAITNPISITVPPSGQRSYLA